MFASETKCLKFFSASETKMPQVFLCIRNKMPQVFPSLYLLTFSPPSCLLTTRRAAAGCDSIAATRISRVPQRRGIPDSTQFPQSPRGTVCGGGGRGREVRSRLCTALEPCNLFLSSSILLLLLFLCPPLLPSSPSLLSLHSPPFNFSAMRKVYMSHSNPMRTVYWLSCTLPPQAPMLQVLTVCT